MERDEAYNLLSDLIYKGFLLVDMEFGDNLFIFKTINDREFEMAKILSGSPDRSGHNARFNINYLAMSLLSVDGTNYLSKRSDRYNEICSLFKNIPENLFKSIITELNLLRTLSYETIKYLEGFSYTSGSRKKWKVLGNNFPSCDGFTGIQGTGNIGLNVHQEIWITINRMLDEEERYNQRFSMALMVASASNPKGSKRVKGQHDTNVSNAEERRNKLAEVGYVDVDKWSPERWAAPVDTVEGLVAELDRQMKGFKDRHDLFIEEYMRKIRENAEKKAEDAKKRIRKVREESGTENELFSGISRPLTPEETEKFIKKTAPRTIMVRSDEAEGRQVKDKFIKKIGNRVLTPRR